jgi:NAD(P)-dependent dehydrogenase (short-subunit alcohol dehydrogenase family)
MLVASVAGATRGAGRAIAVELARAGFFVYATGRSSRVTGASELRRPETMEETGDLIRVAGGAGAARVVDHEDPGQVAALVAAICAERGRVDVLVNDIFGGDRYMQWDKPLWEHDWQDGLRMLQMGARGVAALATAGDADHWAGTIISSRQLADAYGVTDTDGSKPDCWGCLAASGWEREDGEGIDRFR